MISPISNNRDINAEIISAINPSSLLFSNNYYSTNPKSDKDNSDFVIDKSSQSQNMH